MAERNYPDQKHSNQHGRKNPIDAAACVAALSWLGVAVVIAWWRSDAPLLTSLVRALMGAIGVYVIVFFSIFFMIRVASRGAVKKKETRTQNQ